MENETVVRFGIDAIEEQRFTLADAIPESISAEGLELRHLVETEIVQSEEKVRVVTGVMYSWGGNPLCEQVLRTDFTLRPFSEIIMIDESLKTVSFKKEIIQTLLGISFGCLRGVLFEKTKNTPLAGFPLPLLPMAQLVEMNRFRVEK